MFTTSRSLALGLALTMALFLSSCTRTSNIELNTQEQEALRYIEDTPHVHLVSLERLSNGKLYALAQTGRSTQRFIIDGSAEAVDQRVFVVHEEGLPFNYDTTQDSGAWHPLR